LVEASLQLVSDLIKAQKKGAGQLTTDFSKVTGKLASAFSKVAEERPPTFLKVLAN
jgi:hypothetical protein